MTLTISQSRQVTDFKRTTAAAKALGVDFKEDDMSYVFNPESKHLQAPTQISEDFGKNFHTPDILEANVALQ